MSVSLECASSRENRAGHHVPKNWGRGLRVPRPGRHPHPPDFRSQKSRDINVSEAS